MFVVYIQIFTLFRIVTFTRTRIIKLTNLWFFFDFQFPFDTRTFWGAMNSKIENQIATEACCINCLWLGQTSPIAVSLTRLKVIRDRTVYIIANSNSFAPHELNERPSCRLCAFDKHFLLSMQIQLCESSRAFCWIELHTALIPTEIGWPFMMSFSSFGIE